MAVLTVRSLADDVYAGLKASAALHERSMEAEARDILRDGLQRRQRWRGATLADLSGGPELADIETPFVRSADLPREAGF